MDNQIVVPNEIDPLYDIAGYDEVKAFKKGDVQDVEYLVKISKGCNPKVIVDKDWAVIAKLFEFWTRKWSNEWQEFGENIIAIRQTRARKDGKSKSKDIKYVGALPLRFMKIIKIIFPEQQFDKSFVNKLVDRVKIIKVGEKNDSWFVV